MQGSSPDATTVPLLPGLRRALYRAVGFDLEALPGAPPKTSTTTSPTPSSRRASPTRRADGPTGPSPSLDLGALALAAGRPA